MTGDQPEGGSAGDSSRFDPAYGDVSRSDPADDDGRPLDEGRPQVGDGRPLDDEGRPLDDERRPVGDVYEWYVRGVDLLRQGSPAAAIQLLSRAADAEPWSRSVREALARAQYAAGHYPQAQENFAAIVAVDPADDYAQFGLGIAARRNGDLRTAVEHLALAVALRPGVGHYDRALRGARAALDRR